ncbi:MAG TPA: MerR family transcriptional regulator [Candidatus Acidoferrales bacterium]|jgi:DNA-binding transcriptional MerR regulator/quercetin dioxygenase-like cupin family protein|nr:MerR family transcriptional regulator [Candidatus Acidoferrales bacterium]
MRKKRSIARQSGVESNLAFTISEAAKITNVSRSTLRIWENVGLTRPTRTRSGYRTYSSEQIERLKQIQRLRTEKNLNVAAIRHLIGADKQHADAPAASQGAHSIGEQLRQLREKRGLTIFEAAERTGLSSSYLSSLERGQSNASVATLQKLSVFYETNVLAFFKDSKEPRKLVRTQNRKQISNESGIQIELLASGSNMMEPHLFRLAPGATSGGAYHHEGEEFIFLLQGSCEICLDKQERYTLRQGDSLYFSSMQKHHWKNIGSKEAVLFWINTPPTF